MRICTYTSAASSSRLNINTSLESKPLEKLSSKGKSLISNDPVGYSSQLTNISNSAKNKSSSTSGLSDDEMEKTVAMIKKMEEAKAAEEEAAAAATETETAAAETKTAETATAKKTADQVREEILAISGSMMQNSMTPDTSSGYLSLLS